MHWRRTRRSTREGLVRVASLLLAAAFLLPELSAAIHGPACPHHGLAPRAAGENAVRQASEAGHLPAGHAAQHEDGAHGSEAASCTCVGVCHAGGAVPLVASAAGIATIAGATTAPATRRDDPRPPAPEFLLPFANAPPVPLIG
jgi:hypothetical protein